MLIAIILAYHIQVYTLEDVSLYCGESTRNYTVMGCSNRVNQIWLDMNMPADINEAMGHETGHIISQDDEETEKLIDKYPAPRYYPPSLYDTPEKQLREKIADYWAMYFKYPDFKEKFPEIKIVFDRKAHDIINKNYEMSMVRIAEGQARRD